MIASYKVMLKPEKSISLEERCSRVFFFIKIYSTFSIPYDTSSISDDVTSVPTEHRILPFLQDYSQRGLIATNQTTWTGLDWIENHLRRQKPFPKPITCFRKGLGFLKNRLFFRVRTGKIASCCIRSCHPSPRYSSSMPTISAIVLDEMLPLSIFIVDRPSHQPVY